MKPTFIVTINEWRTRPRKVRDHFEVFVYETPSAMRKAVGTVRAATLEGIPERRRSRVASGYIALTQWRRSRREDGCWGRIHLARSVVRSNLSVIPHEMIHAALGYLFGRGDGRVGKGYPKSEERLAWIAGDMTAQAMKKLLTLPK